MSADSWPDGGDPAEPEESFDDDTSAMDDPSFEDPAADDVGTFDDSDHGDDELSDEDADDTAGDIDEDSEPALTDGDEPASLDLDFDDPDDDGDPGTDGDEPSDEPVDPPVDVVDEEVPGTDPDAVDIADDDAFHPDFPPDLDLETVPEPVDGPPWSDADLLGDVADPADTTWTAFNDTVPLNDLFTMDGASGGDWNSLVTSDDPAVSSLARWWQP